MSAIAASRSGKPRRRSMSAPCSWHRRTTPRRIVPSPTGPTRTALAIAQQPADVAHGLADAVRVLDQREAHEALARGAEADAGRHGDLRALEQQLGELERAQRREAL